MQANIFVRGRSVQLYAYKLCIAIRGLLKNTPRGVLMIGEEKPNIDIEDGRWFCRRDREIILCIFLRLFNIIIESFKLYGHEIICTH